MRKLIRLICLLSAALGLSACAPMLALVGTNTTAVQVVAQIERVKLAGDGASYAASHKTITDHLLSQATGKECRIFNVLTKESVCTDMGADAQAKAAAGESTAQPQTQATGVRNAPTLDLSREQASGD